MSTDASPHPTPGLDDPGAVSTLGTLLVAARYTTDGLKERLGVDGELHARASDIPVHLQRVSEGQPLDTLIRLFFLGDQVSWQDAAAALPGLDPDRLVAAGVLEAPGDDVRATVRLVPHKEVLVAYEPNDEPPEGSHLLANITVRMHFVSALQAEAATGMHALLAARHTDRAVAVEADAQALTLIRLGGLLNALDNLEAVEGEDLEPIAGHSYGLIVASPSRVLSPDEDERADTRCRELVKAVASHLSEGGFAHVLVTWVLGTGEDWWVAARAVGRRDRVRRSPSARAGGRPGGIRRCARRPELARPLDRLFPRSCRGQGRLGRDRPATTLPRDELGAARGHPGDRDRPGRRPDRAHVR